MSNSKPNWRTKLKLTRKHVFIIAVGVVLLGAGVLAASMLMVQKDNDVIVEEKMGVNLPSSGEVSSAIEQEQDKVAKARLYLDLAMAKFREQKPQEALEMAQASVELSPTHEAYATIGAAYTGMGDTEKALEAYRKALELADKTEDPTMVSPYGEYTMMITGLEG